MNFSIITLTDAQREQLKAAFTDISGDIAAIKEEINSAPYEYRPEHHSRINQLCADAVASVLCVNDKDANYVTGAILDMMAGIARPAIRLGNLPKDKDMQEYFMRGLTALHDHRWQHTANEPDVHAPSFVDFRADSYNLESPRWGTDREQQFNLLNHIDAPFHNDNLGEEERRNDYSTFKSQMRIIGVPKQSSPPVNTVCISVDSVLKEAANTLYKSEFYRSRHSLKSPEGALHRMVEAFQEPVWGLFNSENIYTPLLFVNPQHPKEKTHHTHSAKAENDIPHYGFYRSPNRSRMSNEARYDMPFGYEAFCTVESILAKREIGSTQAPLREDELLLFNNRMVFHGAGKLPCEEAELSGERDLIHSNANYSTALLEDSERGPGNMAPYVALPKTHAVRVLSAERASPETSPTKERC